MLVVHGYAEHSERYEQTASWFAARGFAVHAYDQRGHGRSEGVRCHVDRFEQYLDDLAVVLDAVHEEAAGLPITLVGHSMGGLVACAFLADRRPAVANAVLSGPALSLGSGISRLRVLTARVLRSFAPRLSMGSGLDPQGISRDPAVVAGYLEDPLVSRTMTASLAAEMLRAVPETAARAVEIQVPVLLMHGEDDPLCPALGSRAFRAGLGVQGCELRTYPGLRHEIFNEPEREQVYRDALAWLDGLSQSEAVKAGSA